MEILKEPLVLSHPNDDELVVVVQSFGFMDENAENLSVDYSVVDKATGEKVENFKGVDEALNKFFNGILEEAINEWEAPK